MMMMMGSSSRSPNGSSHTISAISQPRGALAWQVAAGMEVRLFRRLSLVGEYKFTRCRQSVAAAAACRIDTLLSSHHVTFGAAWHF
jgi:opacity protein-like surface antigen